MRFLDTARRALICLSAASLTMGCSPEDIKKKIEEVFAGADAGFAVDLSDPDAPFSAKIKALDASRAPIKNASIVIDSTTYSADSEGIITVDGLKVGQILSAAVSAKGYMRAPVKLSYASAGQKIATIVMSPVEVSVEMDSSIGGIIQGLNASAMFPADSFIKPDGTPYNGTVRVNLGGFNTQTQLFDKTTDDGVLVLKADMTPDRVPAGYFSIQSADGTIRTTVPQSVLAIELEDEDGNPLQLGNDKSSEVRIGLPAITDKKAGQVMDLITYDEEIGSWINEGSCTVVAVPAERAQFTGALECVGNVTHFTLKSVGSGSNLSKCLRMKVEFPQAKIDEYTKAGFIRSQKMELLIGTQNADGSYAIETADSDYLTDASMCFWGGTAYYVRTVVQFKDAAGAVKVTYKTPWYLPSKRTLFGNTDPSKETPNEVCKQCDIITVQSNTTTQELVDSDKDGHDATVDCNDNNASIYPGATEALCGGDVDSNCDGKKPMATIAVPANTDKAAVAKWNGDYCKLAATSSCISKASADTAGNDIDEDCDGTIADRDGDGVSAPIDCNDANPNVKPGTMESIQTPDDDDCDGVASYNECNGVKNTCGSHGTCTDANLTSVNAISCTCDDGYELQNGVCVTVSGGGGSDTTPPNTTISVGPTGTVSDNAATFAFTCSESNCTFECKLDTGSFASCTSPKSYTSLTDGSHTFQVRAKDAANNTDQTPATRTWTVNTGGGGGGPLSVTIDTVITGAVTTDSVDIYFTTMASMVYCAIVSPSTTTITDMDYDYCYSPFSVMGLTDGTYKVAVRGAEYSMELSDYVYGTPAEIIFTVELAAPPGGSTVQVSSGKVSSCIITPAGNLACWAGGEYCCATPNNVSTTGDWAAISVGDASSIESNSFAHYCGIRNTGALYCWGYNNNGQLGSGDVNDIPSITQVGSATWVTVETGLENACGIQTDGTLWCWGTNANGELGVMPPSSQVLSPTAVSGGISTWSDISMSDGYSCGVLMDGTMFCWGNNGYGQLGSGDSTSYSWPHMVSGTDWLQVATGPYAACAIKTDGTLWCWGSDMSNQIGVSATDDSSTSPVQVGSDTNWASVELGADHACAVKSTGTLWCWGYEGREQLGDGAGNTPVDTPTQIGAATDWLRLSAGRYLTLGIRGTEGSPAFYGWGWDWMGQTGTDAGVGTDCASSLGPDCVVATPTVFTAPPAP